MRLLGIGPAPSAPVGLALFASCLMSVCLRIGSVCVMAAHRSTHAPHAHVLPNRAPAAAIKGGRTPVQGWHNTVTGDSSHNASPSQVPHAKTHSTCPDLFTLSGGVTPTNLYVFGVTAFHNVPFLALTSTSLTSTSESPVCSRSESVVRQLTTPSRLERLGYHR